ncbi:cytochrome P450 [Dendrothele bispora CBS 962.96]|uniref:Cytochrome P450 n=1 Tax=Dendrothele bispora (strain CBS 962.96) TaxID=1314807 RepID=A0A4V6T5H8_DENBC|nr:cytochrome P450 [Dendrothele bispora CBS 962.96]
MSLQQLLYTFGLGAIILWIARTWTQYRAVTSIESIRRVHGLTTFFPKDSFISGLLGSSSTIVLGPLHLWNNKRQWYEVSGWDLSAAISLFPRVRKTWIVSDPVLFKRITSSRIEFPKSTEQYVMLRVFGKNILTEEGDEWKKYKRICAPAFSESNNRLVWDCSLRIMSEFFEEVWLCNMTKSDTEVIIEDFKIPCTQFALRVIVAAAFGQLLSWKRVDTSYTSFSNLPVQFQDHLKSSTTSVTDAGMTIEQIFEIISEDFVLKLILPNWVFRNAESKLWPFGEKLRRKVISVRKAFDGLDVYMKDIITTRYSGVSTSGNSLMNAASKKKADLFTNLIEANESNGEPLRDGSVWDSVLGEYVQADGLKSNEASQLTEIEGAKLDNTELMGNIFIFLLAGHETTAHSVSYALALLALYQDEQQKLYQHIISVCPNGQLPKYEDLPCLTRTMAVMQETLRLFPPVIVVPKTSAEDTVFVVKNHASKEELKIPVEKGDQIVLHAVGVHYNSNYWNNPMEFKPDRFMPGSNWPRDAYVPFSTGARSCMGRRFAEVEGVAIITMLILKYHVKIKEEDRFKNETFEQRKERILESRNGLTLTPLQIPLVFTQRA